MAAVVFRTVQIARFSAQMVQSRNFAARLASTIKFTKDHEYARLDGKIATYGITDFAQTQLGDVVYVGLPEVGASFKKGEAMASVESVKAASDVYAPLSGKIIESNKGLSDNPAMVNESAEEKAWFVKVEITNPKEFEALMDTAAYKAHCDASKH